ncbi:MAG: hypothetical protein IKK57_10245 [Clostridia bacterium]|nr:hypothetical protein [Clostridia bacterium]
MNNAQYRINELANVRFLLLSFAFLAGMLLGIPLLTYMWAPHESPLLEAFLIFFKLSCLTYLAIGVRLLFCRVHIDETGADVDQLFGNTAMSWGDVRTAAIVRLVVGNQKSDGFIVLSSREPQEVLTHRALTTRKVLSRDEVVRIPLNARRRAAVEHYLHMTLLEYTL